jgi:hypothetical protein
VGYLSHVFVSIAATYDVYCFLKRGAESPGDWCRMSNLPDSDVTGNFDP